MKISKVWISVLVLMQVGWVVQCKRKTTSPPVVGGNAEGQEDASPKLGNEVPEDIFDPQDPFDTTPGVVAPAEPSPEPPATPKVEGPQQSAFAEGLEALSLTVQGTDYDFVQLYACQSEGDKECYPSKDAPKVYSTATVLFVSVLSGKLDIGLRTCKEASGAGTPACSDWEVQKAEVKGLKAEQAQLQQEYYDKQQEAFDRCLVMARKVEANFEKVEKKRLEKAGLTTLPDDFVDVHNLVATKHSYCANLSDETVESLAAYVDSLQQGGLSGRKKAVIGVVVALAVAGLVKFGAERLIRRGAIPAPVDFWTYRGRPEGVTLKEHLREEMQKRRQEYAAEDAPRGAVPELADDLRPQPESGETSRSSEVLAVADEAKTATRKNGLTVESQRGMSPDLIGERLQLLNIKIDEVDAAIRSLESVDNAESKAVADQMKSSGQRERWQSEKDKRVDHLASQYQALNEEIDKLGESERAQSDELKRRRDAIAEVAENKGGLSKAEFSQRVSGLSGSQLEVNIGGGVDRRPGGGSLLEGLDLAIRAPSSKSIQSVSSFDPGKTISKSIKNSSRLHLTSEEKTQTNFELDNSTLVILQEGTEKILPLLAEMRALMSQIAVQS
ncbi:MAG: hypothetical protein OXT67_09410 [Zetaproteobacteria bacterium]|nr:hypothetical protein [Zetaproteobacteria bacterium]